MKILLTDIDHVVMDNATHFQDWLIKYKSKKFENKSWKDYDTFEEWLGLDTDIANAVIEEFSVSNYFQKLTPTHKSDIFLPLLKKEGYTIIGITACGVLDKIKENRFINIEKYFSGIFSEIFFVKNPNDKRKILSEYKNAIWVEDIVKNAIIGKECGHTTFLMDQHYNRNVRIDGITNVKDWSELYTIIS